MTPSAKTQALEALIEAHATELKLPTVKRRFRQMAAEATREQLGTQTPSAAAACRRGANHHHRPPTHPAHSPTMALDRSDYRRPSAPGRHHLTQPSQPIDQEPQENRRPSAGNPARPQPRDHARAPEKTVPTSLTKDRG